MNLELKRLTIDASSARSVLERALAYRVAAFKEEPGGLSLEDRRRFADATAFCRLLGALMAYLPAAELRELEALVYRVEDP